MAWLDSKPSKVLPTFGIAYGSGAAYDASPAGLLDGRRGRHQRWAELVRWQMAFIADSCRTNGHVVTPPVPHMIQLNLFDQLEEAA
jgi:hypothetical protein